MGAVADQEENRPHSLLQMTKPVDSIDVVVISSDSDDNYQDSDVNLSDREQDGEEAEMNLKGNTEGKKVAGVDVSHSYVQVKMEDDKKADDDRKADDDCCILDFNPFESAVTDLANKLSLGNGNSDDHEEDDLSILAEKGEIACRDFPHSRHQCAEFLFDNTPHESFCSQCYCYVCDTPAPCTRWKGFLHSHCHASDRLSMWKDLRSSRRKSEVIKSSFEIGLW